LANATPCLLNQQSGKEHTQRQISNQATTACKVDGLEYTTQPGNITNAADLYDIPHGQKITKILRMEKSSIMPS
jgi:hypothetical protein